MERSKVYMLIALAIGILLMFLVPIIFTFKYGLKNTKEIFVVCAGGAVIPAFLAICVCCITEEQRDNLASSLRYMI